MSFSVLDALSLPSGAVNEDRIGARGDLAWVIDGATDIGTEPLVGSDTDAAWFAQQIHELLGDAQLEMAPDLAELPARLAVQSDRRFRRARRRRPSGRFEHPSAAAVVIRVSGRRLQYVSVGDCSLLVQQRGETWRVATGLGDAGDKRLAAAIAAFHAREGETAPGAARRHVWPEIREQRNRLNTPDGYGVLSVTPPPPEFIVSGRMDLDAGAIIMLASDGLMRLADVYGVHGPEELVMAARTNGLTALGDELRRIEASDATTLRYPRAKVSDDASGLLIAID